MDLIQFMRLLQARKRLFWSVFGAVVGLAIALTFVMPKTYLGEVSVIVDSKVSDPITGQIIPEQLEAANLATQVDVITSHNVAAKVVDRLKLASIPTVREQFLEETEGAGTIRDWLADKLLKRLEVKPSRLSNMVTIRFGGSDPVFAANVANAFADAYIQTSLELTADPARRQAAWFDSEIRDLRANVDAAQRRLSDYQRKQNMIGTTDDHLDVENARLAELTAQLVTAQTTMYDARTRLKQVDHALERGQLEQLPDILGNPVLQSIKVDLVRAQGNLAQTAERFDRNHPQYASAAAQVTDLQAKLAAEVQTAKGSISQTAEIAERRAMQLQSAVDEQQKRILDLKRRHDEIDVLSREVAAAQHAYDSASQRASEVRLQGHLDQSNIAVLNPAIPPLKAARPSLKLNLAVGLIFGTTLAIGAALAAELRNRRVRTQDDLVRSSGLVVLAELPRLATSSSRRRLRKRSQPPGGGATAIGSELGFAGSPSS
jgi:succinoglycan biosynthesis transport protein ExoP